MTHPENKLSPSAPDHASGSHPATPATLKSSALLPLGAMLLAGSMSAIAQTATDSTDKNLATVVVREQAESPQTKNTLRTKETSIGKGTQALRDIPQTVTVMTEMLLNDRNLDDFREVLKTTAGVTFMAGETGEEDVRLRGFSLGQAGDIYVDGLRDAPLIERDTFNLDRVEILKGSASMLFGKGSTGGVVNQVSKLAVTDRQIREAALGGALTLKDLRRDLGVTSECGRCASCARSCLKAVHQSQRGPGQPSLSALLAC